MWGIYFSASIVLKLVYTVKDNRKLVHMNKLMKANTSVPLMLFMITTLYWVSVQQQHFLQVINSELGFLKLQFFKLKFLLILFHFNHLMKSLKVSWFCLLFSFFVKATIALNKYVIWKFLVATRIESVRWRTSSPIRAMYDLKWGKKPLIRTFELINLTLWNYSLGGQGSVLI